MLCKKNQEKKDKAELKFDDAHKTLGGDLCKYKKNRMITIINILKENHKKKK